MDALRFDGLSKVIGRRGVLGLAAAGALSGRGVLAAPKCRGEGHPCEGNQTCCSGLVCIVSGPGQAERCTVPAPPPDPVDPTNPVTPVEEPTHPYEKRAAEEKEKCRSGKAKSKRCLGRQKREHCHPGRAGECAPGWTCQGGREAGKHPSCVKD